MHSHGPTTASNPDVAAPVSMLHRPKAHSSTKPGSTSRSPLAPEFTATRTTTPGTSPWTRCFSTTRLDSLSAATTSATVLSTEATSLVRSLVHCVSSSNSRRLAFSRRLAASRASIPGRAPASTSSRTRPRSSYALCTLAAHRSRSEAANSSAPANTASTTTNSSRARSTTLS